MPSVTDKKPKYVRDDLRRLRKSLKTIPELRDGNLLIATWNIRGFGDLTEKWSTNNGESPARNLHAIVCIAEILSRFDVIAIQEVKGNIKSLRHTMKLLGPNWGFLMTDVTRGDAGNKERMAFVFNRDRVKPSGLACELVVPRIVSKKLVDGANAFQRQFVRTPYAVSFIRESKTFILTTLHVFYGKKTQPEKRINELKAIAKWLANWARKLKSYGKVGHGHNLLALGDFNIDRKGDDLYEAFISKGLYIPDDISAFPSTIFSKPGKPKSDMHYDQIAWFNGAKKVPKLSMKYSKGGFVDFKKDVMRDLDNTKLSWRMSDHYPLWVEFEV